MTYVTNIARIVNVLLSLLVSTKKNCVTQLPSFLEKLSIRMFEDNEDKESSSDQFQTIIQSSIFAINNYVCFSPSFQIAEIDKADRLVELIVEVELLEEIISAYFCLCLDNISVTVTNVFNSGCKQNHFKIVDYSGFCYEFSFDLIQNTTIFI